MKNCFIDEQPKFKKDVKVDGEKIATIHALTRKDQAILEEETTEKTLENGEIKVKINFTAHQLKRMYLSLKGFDCGWELDRELTEENVSKLNDKYFNAIDGAIADLNENFDMEDIEKN